MQILKNLIGGGKNRESNIEFARMISMFLILVIHANMVSLPHPTSVDLSNDSLEVVFRYFMESVGIVSVNLFILISGWFTIKPNTKRMLSFIYQVVFLWGGMLLILAMLGLHTISLKDIASSIALTSSDWFIKAYLVLCIISPILNSFAENSSEKTFRSALIWFFIFQSTYGILGASRFFEDGYGPLSFIGLYLLAQYARKVTGGYFSKIDVNKLFILKKEIDISIFMLCAIINTVIGVVALKLDINLYGKIYAYINPFNIIGALYLFLFFTKINIGRSKIINWLAASCFAVYLLHGNQMREYFTNTIQDIYDSYNGASCVLVVFLFLVLVYVASVVIDQLRIITWNLLCNFKEKCQTIAKP